jgi:hypothetical protein
VSTGGSNLCQGSLFEKNAPDQGLGRLNSKETLSFTPGFNSARNSSALDRLLGDGA